MLKFGVHGARDDIKSSEKFAIRSSFKIGGREGVQLRWLFKIAETSWNPVLFKAKWSRKCLKVQRDAKTIFPDTFCIHRVRGLCPYLPSILTEYTVYLGVVKRHWAAISMVNLMHCANPSYILAINKCSLLIETLYGLLFDKLGWGNSVIKIEWGGRGSNLSLTNYG